MFNCHYHEIVTEYHISHARSARLLPRFLHALLINMYLIDSACTLFELNRKKYACWQFNFCRNPRRGHLMARFMDEICVTVCSLEKCVQRRGINHAGKQLFFLLFSRRIMFLDFIYVCVLRSVSFNNAGFKFLCLALATMPPLIIRPFYGELFTSNKSR